MRLWEIVARSPHLVRALHAARDVDAPQWLITAGAIRDAVWDALHDRPLHTLPRDLDLAFFDPADLSAAREESVELQLRLHAPDLPWDVNNQASVHLWYPDVFGLEVQPFASCAEAVATFPETAACVGVRLTGDGDLLVVAPHGLADLLGGVCRHNATRVSAEFYRRRVCAKGGAPVGRRSSSWPCRRRRTQSWAGRRRMPPGGSAGDNRLSGTVRRDGGRDVRDFSGTLELMRVFEELVPIGPRASESVGAEPSRPSAGAEAEQPGGGC